MSTTYFTRSVEKVQELFYLYAYFVNLFFYSILFAADIATMAYFIKMTVNFMDMLGCYYKFQRCRFLVVLYSICIWTLITLFRFDIFYNLVELLICLGNRNDLIDSVIKGWPNRSMTYMSKLTPIIVVLLTHFIVRYIMKKLSEG